MRLGTLGLAGVVLGVLVGADARAEDGPVLRGAVQPAPVRVAVIEAPARVPATTVVRSAVAEPVVARTWTPPARVAYTPAPAAYVAPTPAARTTPVYEPAPAPQVRASLCSYPVPAPPYRRGPVEVRDEWILAQPHLTLPAMSPDPLGRGRWMVRLELNRGNDFGWTQTRAGELPQGGDRRFIVDGEHMTVALQARYGLSSTVDVGLRVPWHWRGPGFMDGPIDWFHSTTGFMDNIRSDFRNDLYRVEGRDQNFVPFSWTDDPGSGLGRIEASAQWAFLSGPSHARGWTAALAGRVALPTGTEPYDSDGVDAGLQVVAAHPIGSRLDAYLGVGGTWFGELEIDGVVYERLRGSGFVALEWRPWRRWSFCLEANLSSRLVTNIASYPAVQSYLNFSSKYDLSSAWRLELGFTENLENQQSTTDFGAFLGLVARF